MMEIIFLYFVDVSVNVFVPNSCYTRTPQYYFMTIVCVHCENTKTNIYTMIVPKNIYIDFNIHILLYLPYTTIFYLSKLLSL